MNKQNLFLVLTSCLIVFIFLALAVIFIYSTLPKDKVSIQPGHFNDPTIILTSEPTLNYDIVDVQHVSVSKKKSSPSSDTLHLFDFPVCDFSFLTEFNLAPEMNLSFGGTSYDKIQIGTNLKLFFDEVNSNNFVSASDFFNYPLYDSDNQRILSREDLQNILPYLQINQSLFSNARLVICSYAEMLDYVHSFDESENDLDFSFGNNVSWAYASFIYFPSFSSYEPAVYFYDKINDSWKVVISNS